MFSTRGAIDRRWEKFHEHQLKITITCTPTLQLSLSANCHYSTKCEHLEAIKILSQKVKKAAKLKICKITSSSFPPLNTSLNSPGGACLMKSEAIRTWDETKHKELVFQWTTATFRSLTEMYLIRYLFCIWNGLVIITHFANNYLTSRETYENKMAPKTCDAL